ncbi:MAG: PD-(D/E)XK nuclease family protein [Gammaproteobacteria bacterium]|nr:PD-(D/E)XK nuclease family protein [Gammaproteobacteria bacterium]
MNQPASLFQQINQPYQLKYQHPRNPSELTEQPAIKIDIHIHSQTSRIVGTVIHEILQSFSENSLSTFPVGQYQSRLFSLGILPHEIQSAIETVKTAVEKTIADVRGQWILSNKHHDSQCELALTHLADSEIQHVIIDRTFIDENDTRWIIDYKTAQPKENEKMADFLEKQKSEYQRQLENYASIFASTENRPIQLGLYFPLCAEWIEWDYTK